MGLNEFILGLNKLEKITRAPGFFKFIEHTVAAHSYRVASNCSSFRGYRRSKWSKDRLETAL